MFRNKMHDNNNTETYQLYIIHRNKHMETVKMRRPKNMSQMKNQNKAQKKKKKN